MLALLDSHAEIVAVPHETGVFLKDDTDENVLTRVDGWRAKYQLSEAAYIVEKTPRHAVAIGRILRLYPSSKIVFMLRDGRDAALSGAARLKGDFAAATKSWRNLTKQGLRYEGDDRVLFVRYENLVSDPEATLRTLCAGLALEFDPAMLSHHETERRWWDSEVQQADITQPLTGQNHKTNRNWQINQPIKSETGRWRQNLTDEQKAQFKELAGDLLVRVGYEADKNW
jgi:hypothetical protein